MYHIEYQVHISVPIVPSVPGAYWWTLTITSLGAQLKLIGIDSMLVARCLLCYNDDDYSGFAIIIIIITILMVIITMTS